MLRRRLASILACALLLPAGAALTACDGGNGQVSVSIDYDDQASTGPFTPGSTAQFKVVVANNGPGTANGIAVNVDMPSTFHYKSTGSIDTDADSVRTQPLDAREGTGNPQWGFWDLAAPAPGATGSSLPNVTIHFSVTISGAPATYTVTARAQGDSTAGSVFAKQLPVTVSPSPQLQVVARAGTNSLHALDTEIYSITVLNTGSGPASGASLLIALPPVMLFQDTVTFAGNASRQNPVDPVKGSVEVYYGGFIIPAASSAGPGILTVSFKTQVVTRPPGGEFPLNVQVTDDDGDTVFAANVAPVTVIGVTFTPPPSPSATSS